MRTLMLLLCLCALTACAASTSDDAPGRAVPSLTVACAAPQVLPDRAMSQGEVELAWGRDRGALRECGERMAVLTGEM